MTFDDHRNGLGTFPPCAQCKRYRKKQPATLGLLCLTGTGLWKDENQVVIKRAPRITEKYEGKHGWDVLDGSGRKLSRVFDAKAAAEEFMLTALKSGHEFAYIRQLHPQTLPETAEQFFV